jgi:hypothetical protein
MAAASEANAKTNAATIVTRITTTDANLRMPKNQPMPLAADKVKKISDWAATAK